MKHSSDILLHFVDRAHLRDPRSQSDVCLDIIKDGFRFSKQTCMFAATMGGDPFGQWQNAVCFTDIPLRMAHGHAARYGKCAIGVRKSLVKRWGGNPVLYLVDRYSTQRLETDPKKRTSLRGMVGGAVANAFRLLVNDPAITAREVPAGHWALALNAAQRKALMGELMWLFSHTKEMFDLGEDVDDEDDLGARRDRYYMEREWRVVLTENHLLTAGDGGSKLVTSRGEHHYLPLNREDVRVVVVPNERTRSDIAEGLLAKGWPASSLPTLITFDESADL
jgi:hypothetical protein